MLPVPELYLPVLCVPVLFFRGYALYFANLQTEEEIQEIRTRQGIARAQAAGNPHRPERKSQKPGSAQCQVPNSHSINTCRTCCLILLSLLARNVTSPNFKYVCIVILVVFF